MSTLIINVTGGAAALPPPYRGVLGPGRGAIVSDSPATVLANAGGADNVIGMFRLETSTSPGNAANDPSTTAGTPSYASSPVDLRPDPSTLPVGSGIFNSSDNAPNFVGTDGEWHDAVGTET